MAIFAVVSHQHTAISAHLAIEEIKEQWRQFIAFDINALVTLKCETEFLKRSLELISLYCQCFQSIMQTISLSFVSGIYCPEINSLYHLRQIRQIISKNKSFWRTNQLAQRTKDFNKWIRWTNQLIHRPFSLLNNYWHIVYRFLLLCCGIIENISLIFEYKYHISWFTKFIFVGKGLVTHSRAHKILHGFVLRIIKTSIHKYLVH